MPHFISLADIPAVQLRAILDDAHAMKAARKDLPKGATDPKPALNGHTLAMIFEKASTRTRFSFEQGMRQLGGSSIVAGADQMQLGRGESVADTAHVLSRFVDAVMIRSNAHATITDFAANADVPVINGLSDHNHPCQIMADLQTLEERGIDLATAKLAWIGDGNNVLASFVNAAPAFGYELRISSPAGFRLDENPKTAGLIDAAIAKGAKIKFDLSPDDAAEGANALITDCWVSMGDTDKAERIAALTPYQIDAARLAKAAPDAIFLHCLPAYREQEMTTEVLEGPQSAVWDEAENRLHAQKAVVKWCLGAG
ncbi:ornithine carbamoyltransferase, catabolic [Litorimonas cladophorae]|uniref:Ornithine carbamoyltransferase n=1 Tax=Litorimonas cladophorae TaxID=1220491 RepID=A0A918KJK3_9PROT|nr:ornithine carbamoyltransferase [Litorimonas cladophorae]GGX65939.1 ornithine carbamoyltransferase, catabolic [Litorimonas cladophorae]